MKKILIFLIAFLLFNCQKKEENFKPTILLKDIAKTDKLKKIIWNFRLNNHSINLEKKQNKEYEVFCSDLNEKELLKLTECEVPILRCIAFKALNEKGFVNIREILIKHKNDNEIIKAYYYDLVFNEPVKIFMLNQLNSFSDSKFKFSKKEFSKMKDEFCK